MNSSVKSFVPSVTAGLPAPGWAAAGAVLAVEAPVVRFFSERDPPHPPAATSASSAPSRTARRSRVMDAPGTWRRYHRAVAQGHRRSPLASPEPAARQTPSECGCPYLAMPGCPTDRGDARHEDAVHVAPAEHDPHQRGGDDAHQKLALPQVRTPRDRSAAWIERDPGARMVGAGDHVPEAPPVRRVLPRARCDGPRGLLATAAHRGDRRGSQPVTAQGAHGDCAVGSTVW